ncbi:MAG: zinc ABC transporter substrate-binding protein [Gammaproteobacteria bacterium]|nr:zinc ABC transporter substrate-binding protein [Gammaproteobacteria bacterium]MBL6998832.1 zinc ABC transporter substrate-binding protein [Gammaproteobacteria bacterium]
MRPALCFLLLFFSVQLLADKPPKVIASIKPLQLIANEIMQGAGSAELLIDSQQSPHHFQLRPSQLTLASSADLLIWISDEFETGLRRVQSILPAATHRLQLATALPAELLIGEGHELDGHLWLAADNVIAIAELITHQLITLNPHNQALYQTNSQRLIQNLNIWQQQTRMQLNSARPRYMLDHQFMAYFERSFTLHNSGSLRNSHDHGSSIRQLSQLHLQLADSAPKCLLVSSLPASKQALQISQRYQLEIKLINTLGETSNPKNIIDLLNEIAVTLQQCR